MGIGVLIREANENNIKAFNKHIGGTFDHVVAKALATFHASESAFAPQLRLF